MSIKHAMAVRDSGLLKGAAFMVAIALANRTNEQGSCWPSVELLAFDTRLSARAVRKATQELRRCDLLSVDRGSRKTNSYRLNLSFFEDAAAARRRHVEADPVPLTPRHSCRNGHAIQRHTEQGQRHLEAGSPESTSPKNKGFTSNLRVARQIDEDPIETFALLDLVWDWKAEEQFLSLARTILTPSATEGWFHHGKPRFVIFEEPVHSHGRRAEGLGISWANEDTIPCDIGKVLQALGFDEGAVWPWPNFVERLGSERLPPIRPTQPSRLQLRPKS